MPVTHLDHLKQQLEETPKHDVEYRKLMEARIEAVRTATVLGKKYDTTHNILLDRVELHKG